MKVTKSVSIDVPVTVNLTIEDIEVIYLAMQPKDIDIWLKQLNDVAIFLNGTPVTVLHQLNGAQAHAIADALKTLTARMLDECNNGRGLEGQE